MQLIGKTKFIEITELTEDQFQLLENQHYIIPYDLSGDTPYYLETDAKNLLANKEAWLVEAEAFQELREENYQRMQEQQLDDAWEDMRLEKGYALDEVYENHLYGDVEPETDETESMPPQEEIFEDFEGVIEDDEKRPSSKKKKHTSYIVKNQQAEVSIQQDHGTRFIYDGPEFQQEMGNFTQYQDQQPVSAYRPPEPESFHSSSYESSGMMPTYAPDENSYTIPSFDSAIFGNEKTKEPKRYEQDGHLLKNIDYSRSKEYVSVEDAKPLEPRYVKREEEFARQETSMQDKFQDYEKFRKEMHHQWSASHPSSPTGNYQQDGHIISNVDYKRNTSATLPNLDTNDFKDPKMGTQDNQGVKNPQNPNESQRESNTTFYTKKEYRLTHGGTYHGVKGKSLKEMQGYLVGASAIRETGAYQGLHQIQSYGGSLLTNLTEQLLNRRATAYGISKLTREGFDAAAIQAMLKDQGVLNPRLQKSLELGLNKDNLSMVHSQISRAFKRHYGVDLAKLSRNQLASLMESLAKDEQKLLELFRFTHLLNKYEKYSIRIQQKKRSAIRRARRQLFSGTDVYQGTNLLVKMYRGANGAYRFAKVTGRIIGKKVIKLTKRISPTSVRGKIEMGEKVIHNLSKWRMEKADLRKLNLLSRKDRIRNAPKKFAGKAFRKVFHKGFHETLVGRAMSAVGTAINRVLSVFHDGNMLIRAMLRKIALACVGFLLAIVVLQATTSVIFAISSSILSFFENSSGEEVSTEDVMKSAGGKILTSLIQKDEDWLDDDVYGLAKKTPSQVKGSKVYGGTDPKTGKKYEIKEFGSSSQENPGVNFNFYDGSGYTGITGKIPDDLIEDTADDKASDKEKSDKEKSSDQEKSSSSKLKKAKTTYKGDEVVFASKGSENDGIPKKFVGNHRTTGYCAGCNSPAGSRATSSGVAASPGVTIAIREDIRRQTGGSDGSIYYINGHYYILQDKCGTDAIDIYVSNSKTCTGTLESAVTAKNVKTYLVSAKSSKPQKVKLNGKTYTGVRITEGNIKKWLLFDGTVDIITGSGGLGITGIDLPTSNAKAIISMATVYFNQEGFYKDDLMKQYCEELWEASHKVDSDVSNVYQCEGCKTLKNYKCSDEKIKSAKGPNGRSYGFLDGITTHKDSHGDTGCKKYYCNKDKNGWQKYKYQAKGCKGVKNQRGTERSAELTIEEIKQYPKQLKDVSTGKGSAKVDRKEVIEINALEKSKAESIQGYRAKCKIVEIYTKSQCTGHYGCPGKHTKKYCPGHVDLNVNACIVGLEENETTKLYQIDPGVTAAKMVEYNQRLTGYSYGNLSFKQWDSENREYVELFYEDDWKASYGIDIASLQQKVTGISSSSTSSTLSAAERKKLLDSLPDNLSEKRRKVIEWALDAVGRIPYHFGDVAQYPGYEKNNFGARSWSDYKGRNKKGLDCAKFVDWVYWSTVNNNLGNGSTSTLRGVGKSTNTLKPGDIVVRGSTTGGTGAHTGIFIGYNSKNQMIYVHESSSGGGNVKVSAGSAFEKNGNNGSVTWRNMDYLLK